MKHENGYVRATQDMAREASEDHFSETAVTVGAHHDQVSIEIPDGGEQRIRPRAAERWHDPRVRLGAMPAEAFDKPIG